MTAHRLWTKEREDMGSQDEDELLMLTTSLGETDCDNVDRTATNSVSVRTIK